MLGPRYQIARLQSDFYRDQFRRIVRWLILELLMMALLGCVILYQVLFPPSQAYYANTTDGRVLPLIGEMVKPT